MRPFDLHHLDTEANAKWGDVQALMASIEAGEEGCPDFHVSRAGGGSRIVAVSLAAIRNSGNSAAWILSRERNGPTCFLARGAGAQEE